MATFFSSMFKFWESGILSRFILFFSGITLILIGFYGLIMDFIHNWTIDEYGSLIAIFTGAALMIMAYIFYSVIPERQLNLRYEFFRQQYMDRPRGEIQNIIHFIAERIQGIIIGSELLNELIKACGREDSTYEDCSIKLTQAKTMLENVDKESSQIKAYIDKLEEYVNAKEH